MTSMLDSVYNNHILDLAGNTSRHGRLDHPDGSATAHSRLCGSTITVDVTIDDNQIINDFAHEVKACALGQASAAVMAKNVIGCDLNSLRSLRITMLDMLKHGGTPPEGRWRELKYLEPVRDFKTRHPSVMLTFNATIEALENALKTKENE